MAVTGVFNDTYYASGADQLAEVKALAARVDTTFLAQLAVYARQKAYMKDLPAYLCAVLAERDVTLLSKVFDRVLDNGRMLRNFVQMIRSGQAGRRSLGSRPKKLVAAWLTRASDAQLLAASVGSNPSLADVLKLSHAKAADGRRDAFFKYLLGRPVAHAELPEVVQALESFRRGESMVVPKVPFELLTSLSLSTEDWTQVARHASWTQTRMNLNTFSRHGVFASTDMVQLVAARLKDPEQIARAKVFPYQLLAAYLNVDASMPKAIVNALQDVMELAVSNVPNVPGGVAVLVDTSGSMRRPVTGTRPGATSKIRYVDVAALFASAMLRANDDAEVVPFDTRVHAACLNARDSIVTNAALLARFGGGGTDCASALRHLNAKGATEKMVVYISDNESWVASQSHNYRGTAVLEQWELYKRRVPAARLICVDISPNKTTQARERKDILNVGGFSDEVFNIVDAFARGHLGSDHWLGEIEKIQL